MKARTKKSFFKSKEIEKQMRFAPLGDMGVTLQRGEQGGVHAAGAEVALDARRAAADEQVPAGLQRGRARVLAAVLRRA